MKVLANREIMYTLQVYFRKNILPELDNDDRLWSYEFKLWLLEQGAAIDYHPDSRLMRNGLGIEPNYDRLVFEDKFKFIMFILRWS